MFGFLRPRCGDHQYRRAYARCCQIQHRVYGISTLPALSYETTALYLLCIDAGHVPPPMHPEPICCRLRIHQTTLRQDDLRIAEYCASAGLLLLKTKLEDDIRDVRSVLAWCSNRWFRKPFLRARTFLSAVEKDLPARLDDLIHQHLAIERERTADLAAYRRPTGEAFGLLFAGVVNLFPADHQPLQQTFCSIGRAIGNALIVFDCAADWWKDARRGQFNPVTTKQSAADALIIAAEELCKAAAICREHFGAASDLSRLLIWRAESLLGNIWTPSICREHIERAGLTREPGFTYAYCDGCDCDCSGCDGCDCPLLECGGCDPCGDASGPSGCDCTPCHCWCCCDGCCGDSDFGHRKKESHSKEANEAVSKEVAVSDLVGKQGLAITPLNPSGIVEIDGGRQPAIAEYGSLRQQTRIIVVRETNHGLIVRECKDDSKEDPEPS